MRILIVSPFAYHSRSGHGGAAVSFSQLTALAEDHEIYFVSFASEADNEHDLGELKKYCRETFFIHQSTDLFHRKISALLGCAGVPAWLYYSPLIKETITRIVRDEKIDLAIVQFPVMARYADFIRCRKILDVQDLYSISFYRKFLAGSSWKKKCSLFSSWLGWLRYEHKYYRKFDALITLTEQDRTGINIFMPGVKADSLPLMPQKSAALLKRTPDEPFENRMVFVGWLQHPPNIDAVSYFMQDILPIIQDKNKEIAFHMVGRGVPPWLKNQENERIKFLGFIDDLDSYLASSKLIVIPLRFGGGVKIKTLSALSNGCAIVSTSIGAEGAGLTDGKEIIVRDDPRQFASAVLDLLADEDRLRKLRENVIAYLDTKHDDRKNRLNQLLLQVVERNP